MRTRRLRPLLTACALAAPVMTGLTACQSGYRAFEEQLDQRIAAGDYAGARDLAVARAERRAGDEINRVIYNLEAARAAQMAGDLETSREFFARVHADVRPYLDEKAEAKVTEALATTAVNQTTATFRGTPVDRVMATALDAVNAIGLGDFEGARVRLNLAREWQEDAVRRYAGRIERSEERLAEDARRRGVNLDAGRIESIMGTHYADLADLRAYGEFRNPFASHLRGVFLMAAGGDATDLERARFELRQVLAMEPGVAPAVLPDLDRLEGLAEPGPTTWVYVMAGRAPRLEEFALHVPIPVGDVNYVAAAFPVLRFQDGVPGPVRVEAGGTVAEAALLADVDTMVAAEFRDRLPTIIAQELLSAGLKAGATYAARESGGSLAQLIGIIYQAATANADTRSWRTLPKRILLARAPTPEDGLLRVRIGASSWPVTVDPARSHIIVFTLPHPLAAGPSVVRAALAPPAREMAREP